MYFIANDKKYDVVIEYKNNKNMYLRVKDDLKIYITAPRRIGDNVIKKFIDDNSISILKMINSIEEKVNRLNGKMLYLGKSYDICYIENKKIIFTNDKVFVGRNFNIDNFYKKEALRIFKERFDYCYSLFNENVCYPLLKVRWMKSKWGVCNVSKKQITLNLELIKLDLKYLDYVIFHELSHLVYADHSKAFWDLVSKYVPNYKKYRKEMKNII